MKKGIFVKIGFYLALSILFFGCSSDSSYSKSPDNGDLDKTFAQTKAEKSALEKENKLKDSLFANGWQESSIGNGAMPDCYNFRPKHAKKIDNYLTIHVGGGTDVVLKLIELDTEKAIRYVFVNSNSSYSIKNIPKGKYYLKIAYGKNWISKVENGQCIGRFLRSPIYERGEDVLDYNFKKTEDGYQVPSFELSLDIIASEKLNSFESKKISEDEFNL